ncbi:MAG: glycosyl hydrolase family 8 [Fibrobacter sp.]|nr:glycosyl hydrolase family 8 [Fibrobacter sp.]
MKNILKVALGATLLTAAVATAGQYPFPQNKKSPYGYTVPFATTDVIKSHYQTWKSTWYDASKGWILSPEGTCSTVSEAIAYGMMITVYMDDETMFKSLYNTWKTNNASGDGLGGMHWRLGCEGGTGSATDSDIDAALALVQASAQWNNASYLSDAKTIINWIGTNDFNSNNTLKPGNAWNDAFNPSYAGLANFRLFQKVTNDSKWETRRAQVAKDLLACQNSTSGLVADWCDWNSHQPTKTSASVAQTEAAGFYDDAARTPWRTAWAYYWYGDSDAKTFNTKVAKWLVPATMTASNINSGYSWAGEPTLTKKRNFTSSTFSGGLGLATAFDESNADYKNYMETVYKTLAKLESCKSAANCGTTDGGEKYYPSTLNLLYLLLMTGNMPNLYDLTGFTSFTPDPTLMRSSDNADLGQQQQRGDTTVGVSGFWNWGAYHDKYNIGTKMTPDSGASPLYFHDGSIYAEAVMEIGPEPTWTQEAADAGTLKYPTAGIAMSFNKAETGVDLGALGVKALRITTKSEGPIRVAILNTATKEAGAEPGAYITPSSSYTATTFDMTPCDAGFASAKDCMSGAVLDILSWVNQRTAPSGDEILKCVKGLKFEVKDSKGGYGAVSVKSIEWLDGSGNVIDPAKIVGFSVGSTPSVNPGSSSSNGDVVPGSSSGMAISASAQFNMAKITSAGMNITVSGAPVNADIAVFNMQGKVIAATKAFLGMDQTIAVPNKGVYMVRVGNKISKISVK